MLCTEFPRHRRLIVPHVHPVETDYIISGINQPQTKIFFFPAIVSRRGFVHTNWSNRRETQYMAASDEYCYRTRCRSRRKLRTIRRKNIESDRGDCRVLFEKVDRDRNFIALHKPSVVVQANEVISVGSRHQLIARGTISTAF